MAIAEEWADIVQGLGDPGTPNGGVLSIQGVAGMTAVSVDTELPAAVNPVNDALAPANSPTGIGLLAARTTGANTWESPRSGGDDTATVGEGTLGRLFVAARQYGHNGNAAWERMRSADGMYYGDHYITQSVTVTGGANAIATATLPAAGAGLFHFITHINIRRVATAALAGGALLAVTTTNLGGRSWRTGNQASITVATYDWGLLIDQEYVHPLRSDVANTNTTIVCPAAGAAVSWQIVVDYFTGRG